jgi:hypothetical protein
MCKKTHYRFNHAHGQCLLSMGTGFFKEIVEIKGDSGQIPQIFQQRKQGKEYSHGR